MQSHNPDTQSCNGRAAPIITIIFILFYVLAEELHLHGEPIFVHGVLGTLVTVLSPVPNGVVKDVPGI